MSGIEGTIMSHWRRAAIDGCVSGTIASLTSTAALTLCGWIERRRPAAPNNAPSQWIWGETAGYATRATARHTVVGFAVHHAMSIFWAVLHERTFGSRVGTSAPLAPIAHGVATAAVASFVDFKLTPRRFQPGFDKHLSTRSLVLVYAAFGLGLASFSLAKRRYLRERSLNPAVMHQ
jgi:hypothetical protein